MDIHAMACEALYPALSRPNARILDVGCGSGYLTAVFARLNPSATVVGIDCVPGLVDMSRANIAQHDSDLLRSHIKLAVSDGTKGYPDGAPYDVIHVGAAAERVPGPLLQQLKVGGMMLIPVGPIYIVQVYVRHGTQ
jgi:protein-L-isoaspartate(D-aspartate) O-methyltransferase